MTGINPYSRPDNGPAIDWIPIVPGATPLPAVIRAIRANTAGTVTVTTAVTGQSRTLRFADGEERTIWASHVTAATAGGLEGAV